MLSNFKKLMMKWLRKNVRLVILLGFVFFTSNLVCAEDVLPSAGQSLFSKAKHIEYIVGNSPVIISAPHGGRLAPASIPDRKNGVLLADGGTDRLARDIAQAFHRQTGKYPHVIICHLKRLKVDCNREVKEAAQGSIEAQQAWTDFHHYIEQARRSVIEKYGGGFYIDLHGHGHPEIRLELGYLLSNRQLKAKDEKVEELQGKSSIRKLADDSKASFAELLRGDSSFGALMQERGFPSVPSPEFPHAGEAKYFNGGYNTRRYGSRDGGKISGFQVECPGKGVRNSKKNRRIFAKAFADAVTVYLETHAALEVGE